MKIYIEYKQFTLELKLGKPEARFVIQMEPKVRMWMQKIKVLMQLLLYVEVILGFYVKLVDHALCWLVSLCLMALLKGYPQCLEMYIKTM